MILVIVTSQIREGRMAEFLAACRETRPKVLAEKGCLGYEHALDTQSPLRSQESLNPNRVTLIETWESLEALVEHSRSSRGHEFAQQVRDLREHVTVRVTKSAF